MSENHIGPEKQGGSAKRTGSAVAEPIVQGAVEANIRDSFLSRLADERKGVRALSIRELDPEGKFERTVHCYPGRISVFQRPLSALLSSVASLSTSVSASGSIRRVADIRIGREPIHESEISYADPAVLLRFKESLFQLLISRGLTGPEVTRIADSLFLRGCLEKLPSEMTIAERKRAAIILAASDRMRVVIFDSPFDGMSKDEVNGIAKYLLDVARRNESSEQIYLVTGVSQLPKDWRATPYVRRSGRTESAHRGLKSVRTLVIKARELFAHSGIESRSEVRQSRIITRPQRVFVPQAIKEVDFKSETIANPALAAKRPAPSVSAMESGGEKFDAKQVQLPEVEPPVLGDVEVSSARASGKKKGDLTKVTATMKIARLAGLNDRKKRSRVDVEPVLPTNVRVVRDRVRFRVRVLIYSAIVVASVTILMFFFAA